MTDLKEVIIQDSDIPKALKKQFKEVIVYSNPLPEKIYAVFYAFDSERLGVMVSPMLTYDGIVAYLGTYSRGKTKDVTEAFDSERLRSIKVQKVHMF